MPGAELGFGVQRETRLCSAAWSLLTSGKELSRQYLYLCPRPFLHPPSYSILASGGEL